MPVTLRSRPTGDGQLRPVQYRRSASSLDVWTAPTVRPRPASMVTLSMARIGLVSPSARSAEYEPCLARALASLEVPAARVPRVLQGRRLFGGGVALGSAGSSVSPTSPGSPVPLLPGSLRARARALETTAAGGWGGRLGRLARSQSSTCGLEDAAPTRSVLERKPSAPTRSVLERKPSAPVDTKRTILSKVIDSEVTKRQASEGGRAVAESAGVVNVGSPSVGVTERIKDGSPEHTRLLRVGEDAVPEAALACRASPEHRQPSSFSAEPDREDGDVKLPTTPRQNEDSSTHRTPFPSVTHLNDIHANNAKEATSLGDELSFSENRRRSSPTDRSALVSVALHPEHSAEQACYSRRVIENKCNLKLHIPDNFQHNFIETSAAPDDTTIKPTKLAKGKKTKKTISHLTISQLTTDKTNVQLINTVNEDDTQKRTNHHSIYQQDQDKTVETNEHTNKNANRVKTLQKHILEKEDEINNNVANRRNSKQETNASDELPRKSVGKEKNSENGKTKTKEHSIPQLKTGCFLKHETHFVSNGASQNKPNIEKIYIPLNHEKDSSKKCEGTVAGIKNPAIRPNVSPFNQCEKQTILANEDTGPEDIVKNTQIEKCPLSNSNITEENASEIAHINTYTSKPLTAHHQIEIDKRFSTKSIGEVYSSNYSIKNISNAANTPAWCVPPKPSLSSKHDVVQAASAAPAPYFGAMRHVSKTADTWPETAPSVSDKTTRLAESQEPNRNIEETQKACKTSDQNAPIGIKTQTIHAGDNLKTHDVQNTVMGLYHSSKHIPAAHIRTDKTLTKVCQDAKFKGGQQSSQLPCCTHHNQALPRMKQNHYGKLVPKPQPTSAAHTHTDIAPMKKMKLVKKRIDCSAEVKQIKTTVLQKTIDTTAMVGNLSRLSPFLRADLERKAALKEKNTTISSDATESISAPETNKSTGTLSKQSEVLSGNTRKKKNKAVRSPISHQRSAKQSAHPETTNTDDRVSEHSKENDHIGIPLSPCDHLSPNASESKSCALRSNTGARRGSRLTAEGLSRPSSSRSATCTFTFSEYDSSDEESELTPLQKARQLIREEQERQEARKLDKFRRRGQKAKLKMERLRMEDDPVTYMRNPANHRFAFMMKQEDLLRKREQEERDRDRSAEALEGPEVMVTSPAADAMTDAPFDCRRGPLGGPRPRFRQYAADDFQFLRVLGKGAFGKVMLARMYGTCNYFAVKCLGKEKIVSDDDVADTLTERKILALGTSHPYICLLFCTFQTPSHLYFVLEFLNGGDLNFHLGQMGRFDAELARFYASELVCGLRYLHKRGIIYRDLKLDNVLLDHEGHVRIADFGMCKMQIFLDRTADAFCGTVDYMAPEVVSGKNYNQSVDWWSFGIMLYEMLVGLTPFIGLDEDELFWAIRTEQPYFPRFLDDDATEIIKWLLVKEPALRLGSSECPAGGITSQAFFRRVDWIAVERKQTDPPFKPTLETMADCRYFEDHYTSLPARLTEISPDILGELQQDRFAGFDYTNPNTTD